jgi:two-component system, OmpR family, alkaline phosphatase synthesis response regulator PhoP
MIEPKKILIIDDDPDFVNAIEILMKSEGYEVSSASNGSEGMKLAKTLRPDLILLDIMMRERTEGLYTLQEIRRTPGLSDTPVIVISSIYSEEPLFRVNPEPGWLPADLFLAKPVDPARLIEEAQRLTADRSPAEGRVDK